MNILNQISEQVQIVNNIKNNQEIKIGYTYTNGKSTELYVSNKEDGRILRTIGTYKTGRELLIAITAIKQTLLINL